MKRSQLLAASVLALLLMSAVPLQAAHAQGSYNEKLSVYVAGSDALWYFTFGGVNGSAQLNALESTPGLGWYNVTAISTTGWQSDFQAFGPNGYNLLPVPYLTPQGMFLKVGSDNYADASAAANALDSYLLTSFVSYSNGTGTFTFYSPVSFTSLMPATLLKFLPTSERGFASAITPSSFVATPSPFIVLEGTKSSSGFDHSLVVGSIAYSALTSSGVPKVLSYFGTSSLKASNHSSSSVVQIKTLDGIIQSKDAATLESNTSSFSGSYTLGITAGKHITSVNATVVERPGALLATRAVDVGVLRSGDTLTVTLAFSNVSPADAISNVTFIDNWWNSTGVFKLLSGVDSVTSVSLPAAQRTTPVYRLQYTGSSTGPMTIPASVVRYSYSFGGKTFNASTTLNPITLSLGVDAPVVYAIAKPVGAVNGPVGSHETLNITVVNVGTLPASSVIVAGKQVPGLAAKTSSSLGGTATVTLTQSAPSMTDVNFTKSFGVTYQDPSGSNLQATTNEFSDVFSHVAMVTGFPTLSVSSAIAALSSKVTNLTLSFVVSNLGLDNLTSFSASGTLPQGLGCGKVVGTGLSCSAGLVTISYPQVNKSSTERTYLVYNVTTPSNYIIGPFAFTTTTSGQAVSGKSNLVAVPLGLRLYKVFTPAQLFGGMGSNVDAIFANAGPLPYYNVTVTANADSFDKPASSATLSKSAGNIAQGANATISYTVTTFQTYGNLTATAVKSTFYFAGTSFNLQGPRGKVEVYQPLSVSIVTSPAVPEEGKSFTITFEINNPSGVSVSSVLFTLPVPSGLTLSGLQGAQVESGLFTMSAASLGPGANATASAKAVAGSGITVPFSGAKLTFSYAGTTVNGVAPNSSGIAISENVTTRYIIPTAVVLLAMLGVAFYMRRLASTSPAYPK